MATYKVIRNKAYGDYRVAQYIDNEWYAEFDDNWNKSQAEKVMQLLIESNDLEFFGYQTLNIS